VSCLPSPFCTFSPLEHSSSPPPEFVMHYRSTMTTNFRRRRRRLFSLLCTLRDHHRHIVFV
jgi:hypothetical protein